VRVVIIVHSVSGERIEAKLVRMERRHLWVSVNGVERRFSLHRGFEVPEGGSWSAWRLSGADHRAFQPRDSNPDDDDDAPTTRTD
jgi:hypothetical protein